VLTIVLLLRLVFPPGRTRWSSCATARCSGCCSSPRVTAGAWYVMRDERTEAIEPPFIPAQPAPPATAAAGSAVAEGRAPDAGDRS
jgi:hypothetical protein